MAEVKKLFEHLSGTSLLIAELLYGSGMRLMELARLRVKDIDLNANTIFVRSGKGDKDRSTVLPAAVRKALWTLCTNPDEFFAGYRRLLQPPVAAAIWIA